MLPQKHKGAKKLKYKSPSLLLPTKSLNLARRIKGTTPRSKARANLNRNLKESEESSEDTNNNTGDNDTVYNRLKGSVHSEFLIICHYKLYFSD